MGARASDDAMYPVEFKCKLRHRDAEERWKWVIPQESKAWESIGVLKCVLNHGSSNFSRLLLSEDLSLSDHRRAVIQFYAENLEAYGKKQVLDVWKAGGRYSERCE